ncbi:MAG: histidine phosphatase family protein [Chlamydiae bacterium]|nr:histidine phosphatase family protein [Chlamydiota bacterium]
MRTKESGITARRLIIAVFTALFLSQAHASIEQSRIAFEDLKSKLGISFTPDLVPSTKVCQLFVVQHGTTEWNEVKRFQGWSMRPYLNERGISEIEKVASLLSKFEIAAIYSSDLTRAKQSALIIKRRLNNRCPLYFSSKFRGTNHASLIGKREENCKDDPHVKHYFSLRLEDRIFCSIAEGGESISDLTIRMIPEIREICKKYPNKNVVLVTHGASLRCLNVIAHKNYQFIESHGVPRGSVMRLDVCVDKNNEIAIMPASLDYLQFQQQLSGYPTSCSSEFTDDLE